MLKQTKISEAQWQMPIIPALQRPRVLQFKSSLVYKAHLRVTKVTQRDPVSNKNKADKTVYRFIL